MADPTQIALHVEIHDGDWHVTRGRAHGGPEQALRRCRNRAEAIFWGRLEHRAWGVALYVHDEFGSVERRILP